MINHIKVALIVLSTVAATSRSAFAAVPVKWTATPSSPPYAPPPVSHGSTIEFAVTLQGFSEPPIRDNADVRLWFQTNGMDSAWFSAPASVVSNVITATFGPAQDTGADRLKCFFGAPSNAFAACILRLSHAPGFTPNALPLPVRVLDFADVGIANAPWYTKAETDNKLAVYATAGEVVRIRDIAEDAQETAAGAAAGAEFARQAAFLAATAATNYTDEAVTTAESRIAATNAETRAIVASWESFLDGSNVVFNITNYLSGAYYADAPKFRILELKDDTYTEIYSARTEITNNIAAFDAAIVRPREQTMANAINSRAPLAWGAVTSAGTVNEETNSVWITHPNTVFAGGLEFRRIACGIGSVCVLCDSGAGVYTAGEEGVFRFSDFGGTNSFGFATTASYMIGAAADSISVSGRGTVEISFAVTMTGRPVLWYSPTIPGGGVWEQLNNPDGSAVHGASHAVSWETSPEPGYETCYINCAGEASGFFRATIEVPGSASFFSTMPADLQGGILCTDGIHKVSIDWNGGSPRLVPFTE